MLVVKPQAYSSGVPSVVSTGVNPFLSRNLNPASFRALPQFFFEGNDNPDDENKGKKSVAELVKETVAEVLKKQGGDSEATLEFLVRKNHKLETRAEDAEKEVRKLKETVPDEAAQCATAEKLAAYEALGTVEELDKRIKDADAAITERDTIKRKAITDEAAGLLQYKPDVLADLAADKKFELEVREDKNGDKTEKRVFAKYKDGEEDVEKPFGDFLKERLAAYEPSLKAATASPGGTPFLKMHSGGGAPPAPDKQGATQVQTAFTRRAFG